MDLNQSQVPNRKLQHKKKTVKNPKSLQNRRLIHDSKKVVGIQLFMIPRKLLEFNSERTARMTEMTSMTTVKKTIARSASRLASSSGVRVELSAVGAAA